MATKISNVENVVTAINHTHTIISRASEHHLAKFGLTPEKYRVLWLCEYGEKPLIPSVIARETLRQSQSTVALLSRMQRDGLIVLTRKFSGNRTSVEITELGKVLFDKAADMSFGFFRRLLTDISAPDEMALLTMLTKIRRQAYTLLREPKEGREI